MSRRGVVLFAAILLAVLALPQGVPAADEEIQKKVDALSKEGQDLKRAGATRNVTVTSRLLMYKAFGNSDTAATTGTFFADRIGTFDGTEGHVPGDGQLTVDTGYATRANILEYPGSLS